MDETIKLLKNYCGVLSGDWIMNTIHLTFSFWLAVVKECIKWAQIEHQVKKGVLFFLPVVKNELVCFGGDAMTFVRDISARDNDSFSFSELEPLTMPVVGEFAGSWKKCHNLVGLYHQKMLNRWSLDGVGGWDLSAIKSSIAKSTCQQQTSKK